MDLLVASLAVGLMIAVMCWAAGLILAALMWFIMRR